MAKIIKFKMTQEIADYLNKARERCGLEKFDYKIGEEFEILEKWQI